MTLDKLISQNKAWSEQTKAKDPEFFDRMAQGQSPEFLWFGCSDSRVPAAQVCGLGCGDVFVHRNVANVFNHNDESAMSVLQYAVQVLKVRHIIVSGHYGCGGVGASLSDTSLGLIDNWVRNVRDVIAVNEEELSALEGEKKVDRLCELNAMHQASNIAKTTIVQGAWASGQELEVHAMCFGLKDGILHPLNKTFAKQDDVPAAYRMKM